MKNHKIIISKDAKKDISEIYNYIAENDLLGKAENFLSALKKRIQSLSFLPNQGRKIRELGNQNLSGLFEIIYKPYRIIYEVTNSSVIVHNILHGRRNLEELLPPKIG